MVARGRKNMDQINILLERYPILVCCREEIKEACRRIISCYKADGAVLLCGNGGSCADASHIAGELMKGFCKKRPLSKEHREKLISVDSNLGNILADKLQMPLPAICLDGLPSLSTAFANDVDPLLTFAQQAFAYAKENDILIGISTSGNAENIIAAAVAAKAMGAYTIGLSGITGGKMNDVFDLMIRVPETEIYRVQELHLPVYHAICLTVEEAFFAL